MGRFLVFAAVCSLGATSLIAAPSPAGAGDSAAPATGRLIGTGAPRAMPARVATPASVAVLGDSLSQGTGSNGSGSPGGSIGSPRPAASWATGNQSGLESYADRLATDRGTDVERINLSANGATMRDHFTEQVSAVPEGTDLVLVQMGGNDLCRSSEDEMTPVDAYRDQFRAGLDWLRVHRPETLVMVSSIPDIYSLWYVRGAPHRGEQWPVLGFVMRGRDGPRAPRSSEENNNKRAARILWDTLGVVPCRTMLFRPNIPRNGGPTPDPTNSAEQRRLRVRAHTIALNQVLAEECEAVLRCRFDHHALFDFVSNRDDDGVLLADKEQWRFVDADISTQDHFHPSFTGQRKLARVTWESGYDWADTTAPEVSVDVLPATTVSGPSSAGWYDGPVTVEVTFRDDAGIRGLEYRIHPPDAGLTGVDAAWVAVPDDRLSVKVVAEGVTHLEVRALDVNGNLSASEVISIGIDRILPTIHVEAPGDHSDVVLGDRLTVRYYCDDSGSGVASCAGPATSGSSLDTTRVGPAGFEVNARDHAGHVSVVAVGYTVRYAVPRFAVGHPAPNVSGERSTAVLADRTPSSVVSGRVLPIGFTLADVSGDHVATASFDIVLISPDGAEHPARSVLAPVGVAGARFMPDRGEYVLLADTRGMEPGRWEVALRPDDRSEHRVPVYVASP